MFKLIGTDGREYGPVSAEVVRQWLAAGRANGETLACADGNAGWQALRQLPEFAADFNAPPVLPRPVVAVDSGLGKLIPYRNVPALVAYYCGVFAVIPGLGLVLGWVALGFGIAGVRAARRNPGAGGKVHAWVGIVLGGLCAIGNLLLFALPVYLAASRR
jgi:hypothetical protein